MPVKFRCQHCKQLLGISRRKIGQRVDCPNCGRSVLVPAQDGIAKPAPEPELNLDDPSLAKALDELAAIGQQQQSALLNRPQPKFASAEADERWNEPPAETPSDDVPDVETKLKSPEPAQRFEPAAKAAPEPIPVSPVVPAKKAPLPPASAPVVKELPPVSAPKPVDPPQPIATPRIVEPPRVETPPVVEVKPAVTAAPAQPPVVAPNPPKPAPVKPAPPPAAAPAPIVAAPVAAAPVATGPVAPVPPMPPDLDDIDELELDDDEDSQSEFEAVIAPAPEAPPLEARSPEPLPPEPLPPAESPKPAPAKKAAKAVTPPRVESVPAPVTPPAVAPAPMPPPAPRAPVAASPAAPSTPSAVNEPGSLSAELRSLPTDPAQPNVQIRTVYVTTPEPTSPLPIVIAGTMGLLIGLLIGYFGGQILHSTAVVEKPPTATPGTSEGAPSTVDVRKQTALKGRILYRKDGTTKGDEGAVVLVVPKQRTSGAARLPAAGLRPGDVDELREPAAAALASLGGGMGLVDVDGNYTVALADPGEYHVLVLSAHEPRDTDVALPIPLQVVLDEFIDSPEDLLGDRAILQESLKYAGKGAQERNLTFGE